SLSDTACAKRSWRAASSSWCIAQTPRRRRAGGSSDFSHPATAKSTASYIWLGLGVRALSQSPATSTASRSSAHRLLGRRTTTSRRRMHGKPQRRAPPHCPQRRGVRRQVGGADLRATDRLRPPRTLDVGTTEGVLHPSALASLDR